MKLLKALLVGVAFLLPASAQTIYLATIGSFDGTNGAQTRAGLVEGTDGHFYGVGYTGGSNNLGTVFELSPAGPVTNLYNFSGGVSSAFPTAPLLLGRDGYFYGEMPGGGANGYGYVFRMSHAGQLTNIASFDGFNTGATPSGGLTQGQDGNFYGTCQQAGGNGPNFNGSVFRLSPSGTISNLFAFAGTTNGSLPYAALVQATNGLLYGTTLQGGTNGNYGTIFKITTNGQFTSLFSFNKTNGQNPRAKLVFGPDGNLYGTTAGGGTNAFNGSYGTIFRITPAGQFTSLASLDGNVNGASIYGALTLGTNGIFYGATAGGDGTIFQITTNGELTTLHYFSYTDGSAPQGTLLAGTDGSYYGTTTSGGDYEKGTVFSFSLTPPAAPAPVFQSVDQLGGLLTFTWSAMSNANYQVQFNPDLTQNTWTNLGSLVTATNSLMSGHDFIGPDRQRFYRVILMP